MKVVGPNALYLDICVVIVHTYYFVPSVVFEEMICCVESYQLKIHPPAPDAR